MIYSITEGQQAEEYKARKAKEAEDAKKDEADEYKKYGANRLIAGMKNPTRDADGTLHVSKSDYIRHKRAVDTVDKELDRRRQQYKKSGSIDDLEQFGNLANNMAKARDTLNRKFRHESCGIFYTVTFI